MNIVIPMAGLGKRFSQAGFILPKPLIKVGSKPMYQWAIQGLPLKLGKKLIFILLEDEFTSLLIQNIDDTYQGIIDYSIVLLKEETRGQAETILKSEAYLDKSFPTLVHNCDTMLKGKINWNPITQSNIDGALVLFLSSEERWSYAQLNKNLSAITDVREKEVISSFASTGTYYFKDTNDLFQNIEIVIKKNWREKNEYYLSTVFRLMLAEKKYIVPIWSDLLCFGTPVDLVNSLNKLII